MLAKFFVPLLAIAIITTVTACKPALSNNLENKPNLNDGKSQKLSDDQVTQFENLAISMGRVEELARVMKSKGPSWGINEVVLLDLKNALDAANCQAVFQQYPAKRTGYMARSIEFSGINCPILFSFVFEFQTGMIKGQIEMRGSYQIINDILARKNGVRKLEITNWRGSFDDTRAGTGSKRLSIIQSGTAKITGADDQEYNMSMSSGHHYEQRSNGIIDRSTGVIKITAPGNLVFELKAAGNRYSLNDRILNQEAYNAYVARIGILVDAFKAYTEF